MTGEDYAAHDIYDMVGELGITILWFSGPYYCSRCGEVVTEKICPHPEDFYQHINGTLIRKFLAEGRMPPERLMRPEVFRSLLKESRSKHIFWR
ncbi:MAG: hypothetical protein ABH806_02670 [Candidatus Omnitrophota bacterium]